MLNSHNRIFQGKITEHIVNSLSAISWCTLYHRKQALAHRSRDIHRQIGINFGVLPRQTRIGNQGVGADKVIAVLVYLVSGGEERESGGRRYKERGVWRFGMSFGWWTDWQLDGKLEELLLEMEVEEKERNKSWYWKDYRMVFNSESLHSLLLMHKHRNHE